MIKDKFKENYLKLQQIIALNENLFLKLISGPLSIPSRKFQCICQYCGREYISGSPSGNNCNMCQILFKCENCNKIFELSKRYI